MGVRQPQLQYDGRVAIITGAGAGCGREFALLLARRGARIVINDISAVGAQGTKQMIDNLGGKCTVHIASVAEPAAARKLVADTLTAYGQIDIIVNNAGNWMARQYEEYSETEFRAVMASHFEGAWMITQEAWPHMKQQRYGRVLMISSAAVLGPPNMAAYGAAKGALIGLTNSLALEGAEYGITVNALAPGAFTQMMQNTLTDPEAQEVLAKQMPPWAVAPVVGWLVHEDCKQTGDFILAVGSAFGKFFIGETLGVTAAQEDYTLEFVRDHYSEAVDQAGYLSPKSMMETAGSANKRLANELR